MPAWLSRTKVYAAWLALSALGAAGYVLFLRGSRPPASWRSASTPRAGSTASAISALAPAAAHTAAMNATIWLEAGTAALLLVAVARLLAKRTRAKVTA